MAHENVYFNGRIVPAAEARISVFDAGLLHGASAFTTMLAHNGQVFRLDGHLSRLLETVDVLGLRTEAGAEVLAAATEELLAANQVNEGRVRITLTPGSVHGGEPTILIASEPLADYVKVWGDKGITVLVSSFRQGCGDPTFGYKTGCYLPRVMAYKEAVSKGCQEGLWFTSDNRLAEACFRNVFLVLEGKVYTPPANTPVLPGIVRAAVIELCGPLLIECHEDKPLTIREVLQAQEIFLTGSGLGVCSVVRVERHVVDEEKPGPVTGKIMAAYDELLDKECPPKDRHQALGNGH